MRQVDATWGLLADGRGVIEAAEASGLLRLSQTERNPETVRVASSYGTGELVRAALDAGCRELVFGLGGSATNDGGAGLAQALGYRLLDAYGERARTRRRGAGRGWHASTPQTPTRHRPHPRPRRHGRDEPAVRPHRRFRGLRAAEGRRRCGNR